ncbi:MAG: hypothetical protein EOO68_19045, partial [Moraxellaceae bacterium]
MMVRLALIIFLTLLFNSGYAQTSEAQTDPTIKDFSSLVQQLAVGSLAERAETVKALAALQDKRSTIVISSLEQGNLLADSESQKVGIKQANEVLIDAVTQTEITGDTSNFKKIPVNNSLRNQLRSLLAQLNLLSQDETVRLAAVKRLLNDGLDENGATLLEQQSPAEKNPTIKEHSKKG